MIGSSHRFTTRLAPAECARRLTQCFRPLLRPGRADEFGFWTATGLRTVIRLRGNFTPAGNGATAVEYWVELRPYLFWAWLVVTPLSLAVLITGFIAAHLPLLWLWPFVPAAAFVVAITVFVSKRQAEWLAAFVQRELEVSS